MGAFTSLIYHIIFSTKYRYPLIRDSFRERLYEYFGGIIRANKGHLIEIGGVEDHVHLLANVPPTVSLSGVVRDIKANTSRWMNELGEIRGRFEWQKGYAAFTVSYSRCDTVAAYIQNQQEHHRKRTFEEEYIEFLHRHGITFDKQYLFESEFHG